METQNNNLVSVETKNKMKTLKIATNLVDDSTNVEVFSVEELSKFIKFLGSETFYIHTCFGWQTVSEWTDCNKIEDLFI